MILVTDKFVVPRYHDEYMCTLADWHPQSAKEDLAFFQKVFVITSNVTDPETIREFGLEAFSSKEYYDFERGDIIYVITRLKDRYRVTRIQVVEVEDE